ncbi:hypothetical protein PT015_13105 [Candidatus Mycobacterium wuenschmannii]|uniref:Uncharacterized protein n=1 Tax=Candidatus Mycobacterium wuenschmannii TaxID=3027808 RepID=A0ABY8VS26_9MYCO|nr:hypothetical protein [Candidatus Mycobacterium wuenschmannii]WIM85886.1 hypothetical protein PT015_13105 [Candidatus Mycobacterium wuenschmannii]
MSGAHFDGTRDRQSIERELRLLATVRDAYRESGKEMPSLAQMDALLDELNQVEGTGKHRWENENSDARPSLWR